MSFREQIVFDVPRENYTIQQLLLDSKEYWNVTDSSLRLHSSSTGNIWPSSATIGQILKPNTVLHLTSSNVVKSAEESTLLESNNSSSFAVLMQEFSQSDWVLHQLKAHKIPIRRDEFYHAVQEFQSLVDSSTAHPIHALWAKNLRSQGNVIISSSSLEGNYKPLPII